MSDRRGLTDARWPTLLAAVGGAVTTFLLVTVSVTATIDGEFSILVGLPLGAIAGLAALVAVALTAGGVSPPVRRVLFAYAAFGPAVLSLLGLAYVNVGRDLFNTQVAAGAGLVAAVAIYVALWAREAAP